MGSKSKSAEGGCSNLREWEKRLAGSYGPDLLSNEYLHQIQRNLAEGKKWNTSLAPIASAISAKESRFKLFLRRIVAFLRFIGSVQERWRRRP
jgi:hypothetical protein